MPESSDGVDLSPAVAGGLLGCCGGGGRCAAIEASSWHRKGASEQLKRELSALEPGFGFLDGFYNCSGSLKLGWFSGCSGGSSGCWWSGEYGGEVWRASEVAGGRWQFLVFLGREGA